MEGDFSFCRVTAVRADLPVVFDAFTACVYGGYVRAKGLHDNYFRVVNGLEVANSLVFV